MDIGSSFDQLKSKKLREIKVFVRKALSYVFFITGVTPIYNLLKGRNKITVPILTYHSVEECKPNAVKLGNFEKQMKLLARKYNVITLDSLLNSIISKHPIPRRSIVITFDDGYYDSFSKVLPVLKKNNLFATFFISPELVEKSAFESKKETAIFLSWPEIGRMLDAGMGFGSHTYTHSNLKLLSLVEAEQEIIESKRHIEQKIKRDICFFSFPFGEFNVELSELVKQNGYKAACSSVWTTHHDQKRIFFLGRISIEPLDDLFSFRLKINGGYNWLEMVWQVKAMARQLFASSGSG